MSLLMTAILTMVWLHLLADFVLQSDSVAKNKSGDSRVLAYHVLIYILPFIPFAALFLPVTTSVLWLIINAVCHFATDYVSSRMTTKLYKAGKRHEFFVVIGVDQAVHLSTLFLTFYWLS